MPSLSCEPLRHGAPEERARQATPGRRLDGSVIRHLDFFKELDDSALDDIAGAARPERIPRGEALFRQGEPPHALFIVLSGRFKAIQVTPEGRQVVVRLAGPGDLIGHVSVFAEKPYPATPTAATESIALMWSPRTFIALMARHPPLSLAVVRNMGRFIEEAHTRLRESSTERVERRIAHAVLRLAQQAGHRVDGGVEISFPMTRQDLALMTGATLHTVSRVLSAWEQQGVVGGGRQHLVLRDPQALARIAEEC
ncbi:MAG TPA: Crp/Fnr family transcriptional regulator [Stellaceae bacterium]|nr:Crp/Fnr family transcriptional regulator [Stellaceae bacterium]